MAMILSGTELGLCPILPGVQGKGDPSATRSSRTLPSGQSHFGDDAGSAWTFIHNVFSKRALDSKNCDSHSF